MFLAVRSACMLALRSSRKLVAAACLASSLSRLRYHAVAPIKHWVNSTRGHHSEPCNASKPSENLLVISRNSSVIFEVSCGSPAPLTATLPMSIPFGNFTVVSSCSCTTPKEKMAISFISPVPLSTNSVPFADWASAGTSSSISAPALCCAGSPWSTALSKERMTSNSSEFPVVSASMIAVRCSSSKILRSAPAWRRRRTAATFSSAVACKRAVRPWLSCAFSRLDFVAHESSATSPASLAAL